MSAPKVAIIGVDHRHIYSQLAGMLAVGCSCAGWWSEFPESDIENNVIKGFIKRFPEIERVQDRRRLLDDPSVDLILIADVPCRRAERAIEAMQAGKDVMSDKPGCTTLAQLNQLRDVVAHTGRIWSIDFSERFEVPAVLRAATLVREGAIGRVVQTIGLGPHRLNLATRPSWFFDPAQYGGILCDIACHQIDQFLHFTGAQDAYITAASVGNFANPDHPGLQDFGEVLLHNETVQGYIRVDWYTPDGLPTWGDGRLFILGTQGYIEVRKYVDIARTPSTDHIYLVNGARCEYIDASREPLPYFADLAHDVQARTQTAMAQDHAFKVMELALRAQASARSINQPPYHSPTVPYIRS
ncbi:MAG: Gfo/Idh/MocA family oxidoreductase [Pseudomonadota bacterium]